ncbi:MAG: DEAD/DEAH box helicase [Bdellovibrionaceae bacterium]|nr:DEAD/DEAH box helicase [Pseudobdellovibrionaceae bacterium]
MPQLDSISLVFDEPPLLKGPSLASLLPHNFERYRHHEVQKSEERQSSPRLWNLPEVFRKKIVGYSENTLHEVNRQNRLADLVRYNFSNGVQMSAKDILRHPYHRAVPGALLPQGQPTPLPFGRWPLLPTDPHLFISQALTELEAIMQALLAQVCEHHRRRQVELHLQARGTDGAALKLQSVEFDLSQEIDWRVEFQERKELLGEFKLVSFRRRPLRFFESFAVAAEDGVVLVHSWLHEFSQMQQVLSGVSDEMLPGTQDMPSVNLRGEMAAKAFLRYLRTRPVPVKITGGSVTLAPERSRLEIRLRDNGSFYLQHEARVEGQKDLLRRGWTTKSAVYLRALSEGLPFLLRSEAREIAARSRSKREWDMKLLKHLGILQYVLLETLSLHFDGQLTDGRVVAKSELFSSLHGQIRALLVAGGAGTFVRDLPLPELCSKSVLACFEDFVDLTFKSLAQPEAFYSESGEVVLEGAVEREFRLIHALLQRLALSTHGEAFRKSRTGLLAKISDADPAQDADLSRAHFHFPGTDLSGAQGVHGALEPLQGLLPHGLRIFYKDQPLQELEEDEFRVDFLLSTDGQQKNFNWFELNPKFFLRGEEVDPDRFLSLGAGGVIEYEGKLFLVPQKQMPSLRRLEHFWRKLQQGKSEASKRRGGDRVYQLPRHQTLELLALRASGVGIRGDAEWDSLCEFYDRLGEPKGPVTWPASMKADLKPYQNTGAQWLQDLDRLRLGALLADDMGLGKTLQTLCFLDDLRAKGELHQALIVVPSSLIFNWQSEVEKFTPQLPLCVFSNRDRETIARRLEARDEMVLVTTYGLLMEHEDFLNQYKWRVLIFDEAQNLKNISTKRTSAARSLRAQFKICLTGTPMENHYGEFYSLVDLLVPGSLGRIEDFRRRFVNTDLVTREEMDDLKLKIRPLLLRRTKKEILDQLPDKQETKVSIAFEEKQKEIYRDIALAYNQRVQETMAVQGEASVQLQMLTALLRLRQACSDPAALPNVRYNKVPPKLETLMDSLREIVESGESALVFTQFLQTLEHTSSLLKEAGIPVFVLHGGIPTKQRQRILADFHGMPGGAVLVMTLKTGGVGLNLTKASYVFHLEPWWNPSVENQATDRAHRLGQSKAVQVFRYIMHESLEEKIELLKDRKDRKFQSLFSTTENDVEIGAGSAALSKEDFDLLLGLR